MGATPLCSDLALRTVGRILDATTALAPVRTVALWLLDPRDGLLVRVGERGPWPDTGPLGQIVDPTESPIGSIMSGQRPGVLDRVGGGPCADPLLAIPLTSASGAEGILLLAWSGPSMGPVESFGACLGVLAGSLIESARMPPSDRRALGSARDGLDFLVRRHADEEMARRARAGLVRDVLSLGSSPEDAERLIARGRTLGFDLSAPTELILIEADFRGVDGPAPRLAEVVAEALVGCRALVADLDGRALALICQAPRFGGTPDRESARAGDRDAARRRQLAADAHATLARRFPDAAITMVVTSGFSRLPEILDRYRRALAALRIARVLGRAGTVVDAEDHELRACQLLASDIDAAGSATFVDDLLGALERHDRRRHGDLVTTLDAYLEHNGNLGATAAAICVHVSTLKYRLARIAEISDLRLDDAGHRFHAQLALRLRRLRSNGCSTHPG